MGTLIANI